MRIALVSEHASPLAMLGGVDAGGQNVHVAALARALGHDGHTVTVYTRRAGTRLPARVPFGPGVEVVHLRAGPARPIPKDAIYSHVPAMAEQLRADFAARPPDIVHAHFWMSGLAALDAGRAVGVPVALTYHALGRTKRAWQGPGDTSPDDRIEREALLARSCDRLIATARHETFELVRMGATRQRISLVPCGVDVERFRPDGPAAPRGRRHRVLCVSRLVERKGIDTVIRALPALKTAELVIAGGPPADEIARDPEATRLAALARSLGVSDRVRFLGQVTQALLPVLYRSADVVACTPWYEPFGMVALEAMASGVPTVVAAVGGLVDTVEDGIAGIHVPPRDPDTLAQALGALFADERRRAAMGWRAAQVARRRYAWSTISRATTRAYARTLKADGRNRRSVG